MTLSHTVESCLARHYLPYAVLSHARSYCARDAARAATVPLRSLAKAVVLGDEDRRFVMAVVAADTQVDVPALSRYLERPLQIIEEAELADRFADCEVGAIPPLGPAYGMETVIDYRLLHEDDIFFSAGDHDRLVGVGRDVFLTLLQGARFASISHLDPTIHSETTVNNTNRF